MIDSYILFRAATIQLPHNTIRITIFSSRYDTYRDTFLTTLEPKKQHSSMKLGEVKYSNINLCHARCFYVLHSSPVFIKFFKNSSVISMYLQAEPITVWIKIS